MADTNQNVALDWGDTLESDGQEFVTLPEGDYNFTVTGFERGRFPGSAKMSACNKASLTLQVETKDGIAIVHTDLILNRVMEWQLSAFFRSIGQKKHGERLVMDWSRVAGSQGRAHFKPRNYTDKDGNQRQANNVDRYIDYDPKFFGIDEDGFMKIPEGSDSELPFN